VRLKNKDHNEKEFTAAKFKLPIEENVYDNLSIGKASYYQ
jgi:hypothetical protein